MHGSWLHLANTAWRRSRLYNHWLGRTPLARFHDLFSYKGGLTNNESHPTAGATTRHPPDRWRVFRQPLVDYPEGRALPDLVAGKGGFSC